MKMLTPVKNVDAIKFGTVKDAVERFRFSRITILKIANECGAVCRYGRSVRIDFDKMAAFLSEEKGA